MKYIRTKYGKFYKVVADGKEWVTVEIKLGELSCKSLVKKTNIVNQADSIEELCDEFVAIPLFDADVEVAGLPIHVKKGTHYPVRRESIKKYIGTVKKGTSVLYGMIWIDDNLIKVAKMNEKGELELL